MIVTVFTKKKAALLEAALDVSKMKFLSLYQAQVTPRLVWRPRPGVPGTS